MLRITSEQLAMLSENTLAEFTARAATYLARHFPAADDRPAASLRQEIADHIRKAQSYGLCSEREVASYLLAAYVFTPGFDLEPDVYEHLSGEGSSLDKALFLDALVLVLVDESSS